MRRAHIPTVSLLNSSIVQLRFAVNYHYDAALLLCGATSTGCALDEHMLEAQ